MGDRNSNNNEQNPWAQAKGNDKNSPAYKKKKGVYSKKKSGHKNSKTGAAFAAPQYKGVKQKPLKTSVPKPKLKGENAPTLKKDRKPTAIVPLDNPTIRFILLTIRDGKFFIF